MLPDCIGIWHMKIEMSLTLRTGRLYYSWYSFLSGAELTPKP